MNNTCYTNIPNSEKLRRDIKYLLIFGSILGALLFVLIYGVKVLDFTNDGWLFYTERDLEQHYIGWCHFRNSSWKFPFGLIDTLTYPYSESVIFTDSIPLFAVVFKLFSKFLPVRFQYFGLFGIISFMLSTSFAAIILRRFMGEWKLALLGAPLMSVSFPILQRMFYHCALGAHWVLFLAFILWLYHNCDESIKERCIKWALMGFLCVSIHSYYLPMVGMILVADLITSVIQNETGIFKGIKNNPRKVVLQVPVLFSFCIGALVNLFILGGFYGDSSSYAPGLGTFGSNLNTFVNPIDFGRILKKLPVYYDFQYEGFAYLGMGVILLFLFMALCLIFKRFSKTQIESFHSNKLYFRITVLLFVVSLLCATLPLISFCDKKILWIPYPKFVEHILGIFRSNGRLIWVAMYILVIFAVSGVVHLFKGNTKLAAIILLCALVVQSYDAMDCINEKHTYCSTDYKYESVIDEELQNNIEGRTHFVYLYNDHDITLNTAFYAYLHGMYQNNYYYARDIDDVIDKEISNQIALLKENRVDDKAVYIVLNSDYENIVAKLKKVGAFNIESGKIDKDHMYFMVSKE